MRRSSSCKRRGNPGAAVPGVALEFEKYRNRKLRRHMFRRWWLWALRPVFIRLTPGTRRRLFEQPHVSRHVKRHLKAILRRPRLIMNPTAEGQPDKATD